MGRKKKKGKSEASWVISFLILENSQHFLFSYVSSKERREIIREREHKIRNITYIYICLSSHGEEYFFSNVSLSPLLRSIPLAFKTARNAFIRVTRGLERTTPSCPRILRRCLPPFLRSNQAAWNRVIARTRAQLCFSSPCKSLLPPWDLRTRVRS